MPGVNGPNETGPPSVSDSVAGTVPETPPSWASDTRTTCTSCPLLPRFSESPLYSAVIVCDPPASADVVRLATVWPAASVTAPRTGAPSLNVTVLPATGEPPAIVAVNVTGLSRSDSPADEATDVVVAIVAWVIRAGAIRHSWPLFAGAIQSPFDGAAGACCSTWPEAPSDSTLPVALLTMT